MMRIPLDEDPDDQSQIETLFLDYINDDETQAVLLRHVLMPFLQKVFKEDEASITLIVELILAAVEEGDNDAVVRIMTPVLKEYQKIA